MSHKTKWLIGVDVSLISIWLIIFSVVHENLNQYGLYYAKNYYGKNDYYQMLKQDLMVKNSKELQSKKNEFKLSKPDQNKYIVLFDSEKLWHDKNVTISGDSNNVQITVDNLPDSSILYILNPNNSLKFDINTLDTNYRKPKNFKHIYKRDKYEVKNKVDHYLDTQLNAIGKPKLNLQRVYNWQQK